MELPLWRFMTLRGRNPFFCPRGDIWRDATSQTISVVNAGDKCVCLTEGHSSGSTVLISILICPDLHLRRSFKHSRQIQSNSEKSVQQKCQMDLLSFCWQFLPKTHKMCLICNKRLNLSLLRSADDRTGALVSPSETLSTFKAAFHPKISGDLNSDWLTSSVSLNFVRKTCRLTGINHQKHLIL